MRGPARIAPAAPSAARPATSTRRAWTASVTAAWWLLGLRAPAAQLTGTVDVGVSTVHYDGFLPSGAAALTPVLRWDRPAGTLDRKSTRLNSSHGYISYAVFCLKKKNRETTIPNTPLRTQCLSLTVPE